MREVDRLLANWGRWSRSDKARGTISPTWLVMRQMRLFSSFPNDEEWEHEAHPKSIDEQEAWLIDMAIRKLPNVILCDRLGRYLLMESNLKPWVPFRDLCKVQRLSQRKGRELVEIAKRRLESIIDADLEVKNRFLGK